MIRTIIAGFTTIIVTLVMLIGDQRYSDRKDTVTLVSVKSTEELIENTEDYRKYLRVKKQFDNFHSEVQKLKNERNTP